MADGAPMPLGSSTKLARACLTAGDAAAAAAVLESRPHDRAAASAAVDPAAPTDSLDAALDSLHSLARQELQREQASTDAEDAGHGAWPREGAEDG